MERKFFDLLEDVSVADDQSHLSMSCPVRHRHSKCFSCGEFGHLAKTCVKNQTASRNHGSNKVRYFYPSKGIVRDNYLKVIGLKGRHVNSLIDTGSDILLIPNSEYLGIRSPSLQNPRIQFRGIGQIKTRRRDLFASCL